jgi:hypothetical protein
LVAAAKEAEWSAVTMTQRKPVEHKLKTWPAYWDAVAAGDKPFEVRRDDRGFQTGDILLLEKYEIGYGYHTEPGNRSKVKTLSRRVTWILTGGQFGIEAGHVVMGLGAGDGEIAKAAQEVKR